MTSGTNEPPEGIAPSHENQAPQHYGATPPPPDQQYGRPGQPPTYGPAPGQQPYGAPGQQPYGAPGQQPQYGVPPQQQPYPQPSPYGQYGGYASVPTPYGAPTSAPAGGQAFGVAGAVVAVLGAAAGAIAVTVLKWYSTLVLSTGDARFKRAHFSDVHDLITSLQTGANGFGKVYFSWLGYVLLAAAVVFALLANAPTPARTGLRVFGALVGLAGIALTFLGIRFINGITYSQFLKHANVGFYVMLGAFALTTIASLLPAPSRARI